MQVTLEQLLEAGSHFGHQVRRWNPKMAPYIYAQNDGVHVFDLAKTKAFLEEACETVKKTASEGGIILFVATKRQAKDLVTEAAQSTGMPYVSTRWLGGMLTNFDQIKRSVKKLADLKKSRDSGEFDEYTKHERLLLDREIGSLDRMLGGVSSLNKLPDIIFVLDTHEEATAVREANKVGVPVVGVVDTNGDPQIVDYPIPANDDAVKSITLIVNAITEAVKEGQGTLAKARDKEEKAKEKAEKSSNGNEAGIV